MKSTCNSISGYLVLLLELILFNFGIVHVARLVSFSGQKLLERVTSYSNAYSEKLCGKYQIYVGCICFVQKCAQIIVLRVLYS
jgi:hypothetical protein